MKNKKQKVLIVLNRFNVGGPSFNVAFLVKHLDFKKFETLLIGGKEDSHEKPSDYIFKNENIEFIKLSFMRRRVSFLYDLISLFQIIKIIYNFKPDIIHTHAAKAGLLGRLASFFYKKNVKIIHTYHGNVFEGYFSSFKNKIILSVEKFLAKKSTKIISISHSQKKDLIGIVVGAVKTIWSMVST